jgi:hypothetical protein
MNMSDSELPVSHVLGLRAGDWVEVRSADEILATLDERGCLEALPFMPEMLQYCGRRFRVFKSAHKTCDTIADFKGRRMTNAVHLEGLRCDGKAHGGCQAGCLLFWKKAWLKRVPGPGSQENPVALPYRTKPAGGSAAGSRCDIEALDRATRVPARAGEVAVNRYSCQATELLRATTRLQWWEPGQYLQDLTSRNVRLDVLIRFLTIAAFNAVMDLFRRGQPYAYRHLRGLAGEKTPTEALNLQPGELVEVRSKEEIMRTVNSKLRNRGLSFDVEQVPFCGKTFRVLRRVDQIINEKTGVMIKMPSACIMLEGATCSGCYSAYRMFCPRSIYPYWHEIWLKRVE